MGRFKGVKIKYIILFAVVAAVASWVVSRWNVWFGNRPEPAYTAVQEPSRVLLTMGNSGECSRNITWQCDSVPVSSYVDLVRIGGDDTVSVEASSVLFQSRSGKSVFYNAELTDQHLGSGETYSYRVRSGEKKSEWFSFRIESITQRDSFSFAYFGDVQDEIGGRAGEFFRKIRRDNPDLSFFLFGGDLVERPMDKYWAEVFSSLDSVSPYLPVLAVTGNHEYLKGVERTLDGRFKLVFSYFLSSSYKDNAVFSFKYGKARFFFLDSNRDFWNLPSQREWLERELEKCEEKWKVVVLHHPLHSIKGKFNNLSQRYFFDDIIQKHGVDLVLQGHEHGYARMSGLNSHNESLKTPVYLVSYCSEKSYKLNLTSGVDKYGTDDKFYQKLTVSDKEISVKTFTENGSLYDDFSVVDSCGKKIFIDKGKSIPEKICVSAYFKKRKKEKQVEAYQKEIQEWIENNSDRIIEGR